MFRVHRKVETTQIDSPKGEKKAETVSKQHPKIPPLPIQPQSEPEKKYAAPLSARARVVINGQGENIHPSSSFPPPCTAINQAMKRPRTLSDAQSQNNFLTHEGQRPPIPPKPLKGESAPDASQYRKHFLRRAGTSNDLNESKKQEDQVRPKTPRVQHSKSERVLITVPKIESELFQNADFKTPLLDLIMWKKECLISLERFVLNRPFLGKNSLERSVKKFRRTILETTGITSRLKEAQKLEPKSLFIRFFSKITDPKEFLDTFNELKNNEMETLLTVVGGCEPIEALKFSVNEDVFEEWIDYAKQVLELSETSAQLHGKNISLPSGFDKEFPIYKVDRETIMDTFRKYVAETIEDEETPFIINKKPLKMEEFKKEHGSTKDLQRKIAFFEWIIAALNDALGDWDRSTLSYQARLICKDILDHEVRKNFAQVLNDLFKKHGNEKEKIPQLLEQIKKSSPPKYFYSWAKTHLATLFEQEGNPSAFSVIIAFEKHRSNKLCLKHIPCWRLLQAFSLGAYRRATLLLDKEVSPRLSIVDDSAPALIYHSSENTHFEIEIETNKSFTLIHSKRYLIKSKKEADSLEYGSVSSVWEITGCAFSTHFSAQFRFKKLSLFDTYPLELRWRILKSLKSSLDHKGSNTSSHKDSSLLYKSLQEAELNLEGVYLP